MLRGRVASRWADWVGISQGTLSRLRKGALPDPEKLTAACRAENLSLTWLLDGIGSPYLTVPTAGTADAAEAVRLLFDDEPGWSILFAWSEAGASVVLHQPASVSIPSGVCEYEAVSVIGGNYDASAVLEAVAIDSPGRSVKRLDVDPEQWRRVASGRMSSTELFGWRDEPGGLAANAHHWTAEGRAAYGYAGAFSMPELRDEPARPAWEYEVLEILRALDEWELSIALQMIRGLQR